MLAAITAALVTLYNVATADGEALVRRIHNATIALVSLDSQMVGSPVLATVPDSLYCECKSLYLKFRTRTAPLLPQQQPQAASRLSREERRMLRQIHRAAVFGETPSAAQLAGDVRRRQVLYGVALYVPRTKHHVGFSACRAAAKAISAPQFAGADGAYTQAERNALAKAILREYASPRDIGT